MNIEMVANIVMGIYTGYVTGALWGMLESEKAKLALGVGFVAWMVANLVAG